VVQVASGVASLDLQQPVGKRGFAVVDVSDDTEITDVFYAHGVGSLWKFVVYTAVKDTPPAPIRSIA
jgi:hypothetical protein